MDYTYSKKSKKKSKELIQTLKWHIRKNAAKYLTPKNISSVGIGLKWKDGKCTNKICLQFTVDEKITLEQLEQLGAYIIPKTIQIKDFEVATDVLQRRYQPAFEVIEEVTDGNRKKRVDPLLPGISISNVQGTAGTLGCIVYDREHQTPYLLSNWHVLQGDTGALGDSIVQPEPHDDNRVHLNHAGTLVRSHLGEAGDCAICTIEHRGFNEEIYELGTNVRQLSEPELLDQVVKSGRTTSVTYGLVERIHVITKLYYGQRTGQKAIGCFEIGVDPENVPNDGEISKGGDSGAAWLIHKNNKATAILAGLHFAGESTDNPHEHALACYPKSVFEKLGITPSKHQESVTSPSSGYNRHFLTTAVSVPEVNASGVVYQLDGSTSLNYTHFSLALHKERKLAIWVAWNIDGSQLKKLSRAGIRYDFDPRIPQEYQLGNDLYRNNELDRGHIAKRADLVWGTLEEAQKANRDSFYYTNIAPQINTFNQSSKGGIWGELENAIFEAVDMDNLKVSVFGGPIFQEDDQVYRSHKIPKEFYKVLVWEARGVLKSKGFILTQNIDQIESLDLRAFETYEVTLTQLEERCDLRFDAVLHAERQKERIKTTDKRPITQVSEINWS